MWPAESMSVVLPKMDWIVIESKDSRFAAEMLRTMFSLFMQCSGSLLLEQYMGR